MRTLEAVSDVLKRAREEGATRIKVQISEHFSVEAELAPLAIIPSVKKDPSVEKKEQEDLAFYSA